MSRYFTRLKKRPVYTWTGRPSFIDRKLKHVFYEGLCIKTDGNANTGCIRPGDYILIEGDEDRSYVAKLLKLYDDGTGTRSSKHAEVQWFVRFHEVPQNKRKRLGRDPHPNEVFLYEIPNCDSDIDAETIITTVQVQHLEEDSPFPAAQSQENSLYVKLSWDGKSFSPVNLDLLLQSGGKPVLPASSHTDSLPKPDLEVSRGLAVDSPSRPTRSARKQHSSTSKYSQSKELSDRQPSNVIFTPAARKKLQLSNSVKPTGSKLTRDDVLAELLNEDSAVSLLEAEVTRRRALASKPSSSLSKKPRDLCICLSPIRGSQITQEHQLANGIQIGPQLQPEELVKRTLKRESGAESTEGETPSKRKDSIKKDAPLDILIEDGREAGGPVVAMTPRSRRKSAQVSSARIRQQLNYLNGNQSTDFDVDDDEEDIFLPTKKDLKSSSEEEEEEEEEESESVTGRRGSRSAVPRTPRSSRKASSRTPAKTPNKTPRRTPSKTSVPRTPRTPRHATPSIPSRTQPARKPGNVLEEARARLHVSSVPESLPCREQEFQDIFNFVESKVMDGTGGCMYISGVPGTGKTATVHEVIRCLHHAAEQDELPSFCFIEINGMKMTEPHQAYVQILQMLTGQKATAEHAAALLEKRFSTPAPKRETTVLLVDELDLLWTRKQNVMYNLFDWPTRRQAKLVVLAIANTMDLPERIMINRVASRLGLTRMSFQPYSYKQLQQIISSRLNRVRAFEDDALQLVSRKVAALSGDARRCLDICRRATEICEFSRQRSGSGLVAMSHVMEALDEMFSSPYITAIRCASVQEQIFLKAVIAEFRRLGLEEATFQQVFRQHLALCRVEGLSPVCMSEGLATCLRLGACRLLLLESSHRDLHLRVRLNVSQDDVLYALKEG
ncbi:origin recognition complex subunit 1-like [Acipenser oxyrinchus oxyrinchus]|uniref:Origin recognition complex subunit 1 n=1 Tax=Acipenser oxyrinchus oxyrinchus TaxID=40147 RepID=A0AAD8G5V4_ACIOX|nr:origin recognition complex subunit 1-like [Acipenser oxyrinchus oxyrinchus]